jgi:hypothetical protein
VPEFFFRSVLYDVAEVCFSLEFFLIDGAAEISGLGELALEFVRALGTRWLFRLIHFHGIA